LQNRTFRRFIVLSVYRWEDFLSAVCAEMNVFGPVGDAAFELRQYVEPYR
jgi:hypothetical protein